MLLIYFALFFSLSLFDILDSFFFLLCFCLRYAHGKKLVPVKYSMKDVGREKSKNIRIVRRRRIPWTIFANFFFRSCSNTRHFFFVFLNDKLILLGNVLYVNRSHLIHSLSFRDTEYIQCNVCFPNLFTLICIWLNRISNKMCWCGCNWMCLFGRVIVDSISNRIKWLCIFISFENIYI